MSLAKLKAQSGKQSLQKLTSELTKLSGANQESKSDDRFWYPNVDKAGNGYAVIRFLPAPEGEDVPFVRMFEHGFKGPTGKWYIENCPTTKGHSCPVCETNNKLWNSGIESDKDIVRKQKRKLHFVSNIYVLIDQNNPENEGKTFLFKYGKKVFDKINDAMNPQFPDQDPMNPFDFWEGANFKLKIRNVEGYRNYDKSEFSPTAALFDDDEELEKVYKKLHSLAAFHDSANFKDYDYLTKKLSAAIGGESTAATTSSILDEEETPWTPAPAQKAAPAKEILAAAPKSDDEDEDMTEFFNKLSRE